MSKRSLNTVLLIGRICKPPQQTVSRTGKPMLTLCLAVDRPDNMPPKIISIASPAGSRRALESDYPIVAVAGDLALELSPQIQVGTWLYVGGIFQTRNVTDHSVDPPRKRVVQEVLAADARVLPTSAAIEQARTEQIPPSPSAEANGRADQKRKRKRKRRQPRTDVHALDLTGESNAEPEQPASDTTTGLAALDSARLNQTVSTTVADLNRSPENGNE